MMHVCLWNFILLAFFSSHYYFLLQIFDNFLFSNHFDSLFLLPLQSIVLILQLTNMAVVFYNDALAIQLGNIETSWLKKYPTMRFFLRRMHMGKY